MNVRRELGTITRTEGQVTALDFFKSTHLFCGTEKGDVLVWKTNHWEQMPSMKGHTGRVNSVSVHPLGVLALSVSQDKTLRLWDLEKGVAAHTNKLDYAADHVKWSPDGQHYIVTSDKRIVLYSAHGKKLRTMNEFKRIIAVCWLNNDHFTTGGEDRKLNIWNLHSDDPVRQYTCFGNRIKGIAIMPFNKEWPYIVTISSDERIRVFDPNLQNSLPVCSVYQDVRFICITISPIIDNGEKKGKSNKKKREAPQTIFDEETASTPKTNNPKKFKVIEYHDNQPIRKSSPAAASSTKDAAPLKSILKKKTAPEPEPTPAPSSSAPKKEKMVINTKKPEPIASPKAPRQTSSSSNSFSSKAGRKKALSDLFKKK